MQAIQNLGLAVFIIMAGVIVGELGYLYLEVIFLIVLSLALIAGMYSYIQIFQIITKCINNVMH